MSEKELILSELEVIYQKALKFVEEKFPDLRPGNKRITILSIMKMQVELQKLRQAP